MGLFSWLSRAPARHIIKLERSQEGQALRAVLWVDVPQEYQKHYANPTLTSAFIDATSEELDALRKGRKAERVITLNTVSLATITDPAERETLNEKFGEPDEPRYVLRRNLKVKTYLPWNDDTLHANLESEWNRFQAEVNSGQKDSISLVGYGEVNELAAP